MKVDHVKGIVIFGNLDIESDGLRDPLTIFAETMNKVREMLFPGSSKASKLGEIVPNIEETVEKEHKRLLARKEIIERRKEEQERQELEMDREEEQRRVKLLKLTEEAEQKRLATELEQRKRQRIFREIEEREIEEAQVMERAISEKRKAVEEREKKIRKLVKTMDYLERAKREEAAPMIEAAYQQRLVKERELYEREQQRKVELSKKRHESDLMAKNRLTKMLNEKVILQERIRIEKEERIGQIIQERKQERVIKRKKIYYLNCEEERIRILQEEEEARMHEEAENRREVEAERLRQEALLTQTDAAGPSRPAKYVPPNLRR